MNIHLKIYLKNIIIDSSNIGVDSELIFYSIGHVCGSRGMFILKNHTVKVQNVL